MAVGVFARWAGTPDTSSNPRLKVRNFTGQGINALLEGDYVRARAHLDDALRLDDLYAEAYLPRAMAFFALGDLDAARRDAALAGRLLADGRVDQRAWADKGEQEAGKQTAIDAGTRVANRVLCLVRAAEAKTPLASTDAARAFRLFYEMRDSETCEEAQAILWSWRRDPSALGVVQAAMGQCPALWRCRHASP